MVISYLARLPDKSSFEIVQGRTLVGHWIDGKIVRDQPSELLMGRLHPRTADILLPCYNRRTARPLPYIELVNSNTDVESILSYTAKWGLLLGLTSVPPGWMTEVGRPGCPWKGDQDDFLMDLTDWRIHHQRFRKMVDLARTRSPGTAKELRQAFTGSTMEWSDIFSGDVKLSVNWNRNKNAIEPKLVVNSLYMAMVAMLWADIATHGLRVLRCANPDCLTPIFVTDRPGKIYCKREACGGLIAKRKWWTEKGAAKRRTKQSI